MPSPRGRKRAVLVLPQWNSDAEGHVGAVPAAQPLRHLGAAPEPAVSRRAHAARAHARRLHRQRQRRPDGAGVPPGRARRAARDRVAARAGLRVDRDPRHQPRLVPVDADDGARAADQGRGAESHLAVLRRRRLGRPVDDARARDARRQRHARRAAADVAADQSAALSSIAFADARSCSSTRSTT